MKNRDFASLITSFLTEYLTTTRNVSSNTLISYRDTIVQLLIFVNEKYSISPEKLKIDNISKERILAFLMYLEDEKHCSISTRNQRLAGIHSLFRYIGYQNPEHLFLVQQILSVPFKKTSQRTVDYLEVKSMKELLRTPDISTRQGRRDQALLCLIYDSGCRVQELVDLRVYDFRMTIPAQVTLTGKGRKTRTIPLLNETKEILARYIQENKLDANGRMDGPLFYNSQGKKLTRQGVAYILNKYTELAGIEHATPHTMRHSKAMHMTEADINPVYIRDFLGHTDLKVTQIYAKTSVEMKRKALDKLKCEETVPAISNTMTDWRKDAGLMEWLGSLGH